MPDTYAALARKSEPPPAPTRLASVLGSAVDSLCDATFRLAFSSKRLQRYHVLPEQTRIASPVYGTPELAADPGRFFAQELHITPRLERKQLLKEGVLWKLQFKSTYQTFDAAYQQRYDAYAGNETVHCRYLRHNRRKRGVVICLHPFGGGALGLDVLQVTLPFHGRRQPKDSLFSGQMFPGPDLPRTNEGFGQAATDVRALVHWLLRDGASQVGLFGISLGGYVAALVAGLEEKLAFCLTVSAPSSLADLLWLRGEGLPGRISAEEQGYDVHAFRAILAVHCPLSHELKLAPECMTIAAGQADRLVPYCQTEALWEHWREPRLVHFAGSHVVQADRELLAQELLRVAQVARERQQRISELPPPPRDDSWSRAYA